MCASSSVSVHDDFPSGQSGVPVRTSDNEFARRVHVEDEIPLEQCRSLLRKLRDDLRQQDFADILLYLVMHLPVHAFLAVLAHCIGTAHLAE